jgi:hypothetical protein
LTESNIYRLFRYACILVFLLISFQSVSGQEDENDTIPITDTLPAVHSPRKATIMSTLLPGLGQIYNKKYWKVPVIYATFGVVGYFIAYNNKYYLYFKGAYAYKLTEAANVAAGKPDFATKYPELGYLPEESLKQGMDTYRRWRDLNGLGFIAFYALQVIDANVDAHFFNYDISRDLSIRVRPGLVINENLMGYAVGLKINVHF